MERQASLLTPTTAVSKLRPPHVRHAEITRAGLLEDPRTATCEVLTICAPAGYGKSTLAIQWASQTERPIVWVTLDESDNDPVVLLNTVSAGINHVSPGFATPAPMTAEEPAFTRRVLPGFVASIAALASPVTVVMDDVHTIDNHTAGDVLKAFVDALPVGSQVAFVGRSLGVIPLPLWRGQGRLLELHAPDLTFSVEETARAVAAFGGTHGQEVHEASGGWPVAVFLLSQAATTAGLSDVAEFIEAEVLQPMPGDLRDFVMCTAALGTVNADLAEVVSRSVSAPRFLAEITTVLVSADENGWYRYHPLLQDTVLDLWRREDPPRLARIQAAAARWYLAHDMPDTAVSHAISSGDGPTLGQVVWSAARVALVQGRTQTVIRWLDRIDTRTLDSEPELSMTAVWTHVAAGNYAKVLRHAKQTQHLMPGDWMEHPEDFSIGAFLALFLATSHAGVSSPEQALLMAAIACENLDPSDPVMPLSVLILGLNQALLGLPQARHTLEESEALAAAFGIPSTQVEALSVLALLQMGQGEEHAGSARVEQAHHHFAFHDLAQMGSTRAVLLLAEVAQAIHRGRPEEIQAAVDRQRPVGAEIERILQWYRPLAGGVLALASVRLGDHAAYREYLSRCQGSGLCRLWATKAEQEYAAATPLTQLTPAELRVWDLLSSGMTLSEIAGRLFLSRETVKSHTGSIYRKLGVTSRREAQELADSWS